jgi:hypothetical protein
MRQFFMAMLVASAAGLMPAMVRAESPNQEAAQRIRDHLRDSGQLVEYKIAVRYLTGTVWLQGHVRNQDQLNKAVALVFSTKGIAINQVIRDDLTVDGAKPASAANAAAAKGNAANPLRGTAGDVNRAQALPSSYYPTRAATPVTNLQPVPPADPARLPAAETAAGVPGAPLPMYAPGAAVGGPAPVRYDHPAMPGYAWPSYAAYPNYAAVTYPKQYSPTAWPYIGPFYPYPQVPLGWRKVNLQWDDGWWWLEFKDKPTCCWWR